MPRSAPRFLAEIKTTAKLQHPHILPLLDSGAGAGLLYYVMPYVAGETLHDRLTRETLYMASAASWVEGPDAAIRWLERQRSERVSNGVVDAVS